MAVSFCLDKRTSKGGDAPIRVSVMICGVRLVTSTGYSINPEKWDSERQRVKQGASNSKGIQYRTINKHLADIESQATALENRCLSDGTKVTKDKIKENVCTGINRVPTAKTVKEKTLLDCFDEFVKESGHKRLWTPSTFKKFATLRSHIIGFKENPTFEDFNETGLERYVEYLRLKLDFKNSTVGKELGFLKWFLRWANTKGFSSETAYLNFSFKNKSVDNPVIYLTWDELMKMYHFELPAEKQYLARVRDVFVFACFTSLRYSDVRNLKRKDIKDDHIEITTVKTADSISIELNSYSRAILDKYKDFAFKGDGALPVISNQKMNDYLKELAELCGFSEPVRLTYYKGNTRYDEYYPKYALISTHTARRTFICNALLMGIPPHVVMKWTGHSDYKAMRPYIGVAEKERAKEMEKFNRQ